MEDNKITEVNNTEQKAEVLTFDEILKDKGYQAEFDRRIQKALDTSKSKWEQEQALRQQKEKKEAERLASLSAEEKMAERERQLKDREAAQNRKELIYETKDLLQKENLPLCFAESLVSGDVTAEEIKAGIEELKKQFAEQVELKVKQSLASSTPKKENKGVRTYSSQF